MLDSQHKRLAVLPDGGQELLRGEAAHALKLLGFEVLRPQPEQLADPAHEYFLPRLAEKKPALFLSINLQGLLPGSPHTRALLDSGIPTLAWFVDNPWNLLSAMRDPSWKQLALAVTDKSFVEPLRRAGAATVLHMPLASSPQHMRAPGKTPPGLKAIAFAGRSAFPGLESFFAGQELAPDMLKKAAGLLKNGLGPGMERPDFAWWVRELGLPEGQENFWPGKKARKPGKGAVECNIRWRSACLEAAQRYAGGLTVFGDSAWQNIKDLRPPVDYYAQLPAIYRAARFCLNINSLLLPSGLSQRIFDAWPAGGFCLTDWNAGLEIFPPELAREITFNSPDEIPDLAASLEADPNKKERLRRDWREHILAEHSYEKRLRHALGQLGIL